MCEAAAAVLAIDAITMPLADRLAVILRDVPDFMDSTRQGERYIAYHRAGIDPNTYDRDEFKAADLCARDMELSRRLNP